MQSIHMCTVNYWWKTVQNTNLPCLSNTRTRPPKEYRWPTTNSTRLRSVPVWTGTWTSVKSKKALVLIILVIVFTHNKKRSKYMLVFIIWSVLEVTQRVQPTCIIKTSRTAIGSTTNCCLLPFLLPRPRHRTTPRRLRRLRQNSNDLPRCSSCGWKPLSLALAAFFATQWNCRGLNFLPIANGTFSWISTPASLSFCPPTPCTFSSQFSPAIAVRSSFLSLDHRIFPSTIPWNFCVLKISQIEKKVSLDPTRPCISTSNQNIKIHVRITSTVNVIRASIFRVFSECRRYWKVHNECHHHVS